MWFVGQKIALGGISYRILVGKYYDVNSYRHIDDINIFCFEKFFCDVIRTSTFIALKCLDRNSILSGDGLS